MPPDEREASAIRLPLEWLLALALLVELVVNRVTARHLHEAVLVPPSWWRSAIDVGGLFAFYFASALAALTATLGIWHLVTASALVPRGARGALSALAVAWIPLALFGVVAGRFVGPLGVYLEGTTAALALLIVLAGALATVPARVKLGMLLLFAPLALHLAGSFMRTPASALAARQIAQLVLMVVAGLSLPLLRPSGARWWLPSLVGVLVLIAALAVTRLDDDLASAIAGYGFGVILPLSRIGVVCSCLALASWSFLATALLATAGPARRFGLGLMVLGLTGFQLELPGQLAATLCAFLCLLRALELGRDGELTVEKWRAIVQRVAATLGASEVTQSGPVGGEEARVRVTRSEVPVELTLSRRAGRLALVEAVCGVAPASAPAPLSLTRRGTERLGKSEGVVVETGDIVFDELFRVRDAREHHGPDPILDDDARDHLGDLVEGWLGVWPKAGARYRADAPRLARELEANAPGAPHRLATLVDLMVDLQRR